MVHAFYQGGLYILADVESGAVHLADKLAYDAVCVWIAKGRAFARAHLQYQDPCKPWDEVFQELDELVERGELFAKAPEQSAEMTLTPPVKAMCLHVAHDCDLRCRYCFAATGHFQGQREMMPLSVGRSALDFLIAKSGARKNLEVDFFGGEPLLNWDMVCQLIDYGRVRELQTGKKIRFTLTTNAMAITDEIIDYCNEQIDNVVLSLDGREEVHDGMRVTRDGAGSFAVASHNARRMAHAREKLGLDYYIRGTFTAKNLDFSRDVLALADMGFTRLSMEPVVLPQTHPLALREEHLAQILEQYDVLAQAYALRRSEGRGFIFFHFMLDLGQGPCRAKRISGCGAGGEYVAVTPQGDIYPCHQFAGEDAYYMGNVMDGQFDSLMQARFRKCNVETKQSCHTCWAKYYCSGGCAAHAYHANGDISQPPSLFCEMERKRTECALSLAAKGYEHS